MFLCVIEVLKQGWKWQVAADDSEGRREGEKEASWSIDFKLRLSFSSLLFSSPE